MAKTTKPGRSTGSRSDAEIAEHGHARSLDELCTACDVERTWITELIAYGVIQPSHTEGEMQHFASATVMRIHKAKRLSRDFQLHTPGVALALDLLDEIDRLRARIEAFERTRAHDDP